MVTAFAGLLMFAFAASAAYLLAQRVNAGISRPITALAGYARAFGDDPQTTEPPPVRTSPDELGDLVTAFRDMVQRVQTANDDLRRSNEALRHEQSEREAALARERRANLLKDEFLAAVSHELRTPLNAMMGWAQILARANPTPDMVERAVTSIVKNAQAQMRVIEDLLDVSRIVTGKLRLRFAKVDLRLVVASAVESMEPVAATRGLSLTTALPEEPCIVAGDRDRLQQVLWNLVSNAVKFTPRGGRVEVRLTAEDHRYRVQVSDTGIGIPAEFVPYVFERFRQADGSMTREHGGLGLGLAIVKELTELHGGAVAAASAGPDQGSQFSVILPQCDPETAHGREAGRPAADLPTLDGVRAFVVDDNEDAVAIAATALTCAGATVQGFTNPETALSAWEREAPDVLVCDLAMPRMSGLDLLGRAREIDAARGAFTPAIAISAHATEQHRADSLRAGFHAHLGKPIDPDDLVRAVADALDAQ
jgi:signal transduction histidine kinase/CheY-like chemotaxis protein